MKVLGKLGLVTAAAATVLFIFIYEFQGPVINRVMSEPPTAPAQTQTQTQTIQQVEDTPVKVESNVELPEPLPEMEAETPETTEVVEETTEPVEEIELIAEEPEVTTTPSVPTNRIYGKITMAFSGEQLGGVNIMVPGSTVAKVSNPNGGYTIEVPESTRELVFIYRGKKLVQRISPGNSLVNVELNLDTMEWE